MFALSGNRPIQMGKEYSVGCSVLEGLNKSGTLTCDANGIYKDIVFGALDFGNSRGDTYTLSSGEDMLRQGSLFRQYLEEGHAKGEYGHPKPEPGWTEEQWFQRIMYTEEKLTCHQHMTMYIDMIKPYNHHSRVPAFMGDLLPTGPYGDTLDQQLKKKGDNVAFSIRSITDDVVDRFGKRTKTILAANGFDYVTRPGIRIATKYNSPGLESARSDVSDGGIYTGKISINQLEDMLDPNHGMGKMVSFEAAEHYKRVIHSVMRGAETKVYIPATSRWK